MKRGSIAVLGGDSFLAQYLRVQLQGYEPVSYSRTGEHLFDYPSAIPGVKELAAYDAVVLAAANGVQAKPGAGGNEDIFGINTFFPIQLVSQMEAAGFSGQLITFGSYFEIGDCPDDLSFTESQLVHSEYRTTSPYVVSKRLLSRYWSCYQGNVKWFHIVLPSLYGKGENPSRIISYLIDSVRAGRKLTVSAGTQVRQYLHVSDAILFLASCLRSEVSPGMYNLAPDQPITIAELRSRVIGVAGGGTVEMEIIPSRDEGQKVLKLNGTKARATGWKPRIGIEEGVQSYLNP